MFSRFGSLVFGLVAFLLADGASALSVQGSETPVKRGQNNGSGTISSVHLPLGYFEINSGGTARYRYFVNRATKVVIVVGGGANPPPWLPPRPATRAPGTLANLQAGQTVNVHAQNGQARLIEILYFAP